MRASSYDDLPDIIKPIERSNVDTLFASAFTLTCGLLFLLPTYLTMKNDLHPIAAYWSSGLVWILLVIPTIIVGVHYVHVRKGGPHKVAVIVGIVVPSVLLLLFSNHQLAWALDRHDKLFSVDCDSFHGKRKLQQSWDAASMLLEKCYNETVTMHDSGLTVERLRSTFRIQDCDEYKIQLRHNYADWTYLKMLEENFYCSGWCGFAPQIWANSVSKDSCAMVASVFFEDNVHHHSLEVCFMMVAAVLICAVALVFLGPILREKGYDW